MLAVVSRFSKLTREILEQSYYRKLKLDKIYTKIRIQVPVCTIIEKKNINAIEAKVKICVFVFFLHKSWDNSTQETHKYLGHKNE